MRALEFVRVSLTVTDLDQSASFYCRALGFTIAAPRRAAPPELAELLGATRLQTVILTRGGQSLELAAFDPPGAPLPPGAKSNDPWFQHIALTTTDIGQAHASLAHEPCTPISRNGPQKLPGGIVAHKFRDPDGHPLELIQFPEPHPVTAGGIDHSAIAVIDAERSICFYRDTLGLRVAARQTNTGPAQDALDGLDGTLVEVVALEPMHVAPHLELLSYRQPQGRPMSRMLPHDVAATRSVLRVDHLQGGGKFALRFDPDGHALLLMATSAPPL